MQIIKYCGFIFLGMFCWVQLAFCQDQSLDLDRIVVTKSRIHLLESYSLDESSLEDLPFDSVVESLSILPLDLQSRSPKDGIQSDFSLRGSNFQGVLVLLNGQRINDPQTGHHNSDLPLTKEDIRKIEVMPGVSSSVFGPDAIGGAINFLVKKPDEDKRVLEFSGGQYKTFSGLFSITEKTEKLGARLSVENQESDGFYTDTDFKKFTSSFDAIVDIPGGGEYEVGFGYQEKEFGAYDFYTPAMGYLSKEWTKTFLLNTGIKLEKWGFLIKPNFLWRRHFDKFALDKTQIRSRYLNHHRTNIYTPNVYLQRQVVPLGNVGMGWEYGEENINSTNLGKHRREHKSIFLDDACDITERLSSGLSFRWDDFSSFGNNYTGSGSLRYKITDNHSLRLAVSRSIRIPSFTELYYNDPTTLGNTDLSAEKSRSYEAGYDYKREGLSCGLTFFVRRERDFIDWVKSSPSQAKWQVQNIGRSEVAGIEERLSLEINQNLNLNANYTYVDKRSNDQGLIYKYGPNYIRHLFSNEFLWKIPFGTQSLGFTYKKKPGRDGWFLVNTRLSYNLNKYSQLFFAATNLFNVEYQEIEGMPQPGRWVEAGLRLEW